VARVANYAPAGSLLKEGGRAHLHSHPSHLADIRKLPCVNCGREPCGEAAHVRMKDIRYRKHNPGIGRKPNDKWVVPLCHECHMAQHARGERQWWVRVSGVDAVKLAHDLWKTRRELEPMRELVLMAFVSKRPRPCS
jgi:hypothetical protein